jgi:hypothetical protein
MNAFEVDVAAGVKHASVAQFLAGTFGPPKAREDMNLILSKAREGHSRAKDVMRELMALEPSSSSSSVQKEIIDIVKAEAEILRGKRLQVLPRISPETTAKILSSRQRHMTAIGGGPALAKKMSTKTKAGLGLAALLTAYGAYQALTPKRYDNDRV